MMTVLLYIALLDFLLAFNRLVGFVAEVVNFDV